MFLVTLRIKAFENIVTRIPLNSLPRDKILALSKLKAFADDKQWAAQMEVFVSARVENNVGKGENAGNQHFLLFPHCFHMAFVSRVIKIRDVLVKA